MRRRATAAGLAVLIVLSPVAAQAAPNSETPYPQFTGDTDPVPGERTGYHVRNQLQAIFDADVAAGAGREVGDDSRRSRADRARTRSTRE